MALSYRTFSLVQILVDYAFGAAIRIAYGDRDGGDEDGGDARQFRLYILVRTYI